MLLLQRPELVPSTHVWCLTAACDSSSKGADALLWTPWHLHSPTHRPLPPPHTHVLAHSYTHAYRTHSSVLPRGRLSSDIWCVWFYLLITYANLLRSGPNFLTQFCTSIFHESPQSRESVGACILMGFWRYCQGPYVHEN